MEKILVIEDDLSVKKALQHVFESAGYKVIASEDGQEGLDLFRTSAPAAVVLDLRLPGQHGKEVCRQIKAQDRSIPILILSAVTDVSDKVLLLELGADDYVTKPFSPRELVARVQAAIRRSNPPPVRELFSFADIVINFSAMEVTRSGERVQLTAQEFKLLKFLVSNRENVVKREDLLNQVWGQETYPTTRTLDNHVLRLRQKLEADPTDPVHILTVHTVGYKFVPEPEQRE